MTEQEKIEMLLKPRFKVIADYFFSPYKIGDLVEMSLKVPYPSFLATETPHEDFEGKPSTSANWVQLPEIEKYTHLFKSLQWWEERNPEEMPEYVKDTGENVVCKAEWRNSKHGLSLHLDQDRGHWQVVPNVMCFFEIATESEYLQYHAQKSNIK